MTEDLASELASARTRRGLSPAPLRTAAPRVSRLFRDGINGAGPVRWV